MGRLNTNRVSKHRRAFFGKGEGDTAAYSSAATCDYRYLSVELACQINSGQPATDAEAGT